MFYLIVRTIVEKKIKLYLFDKEKLKNIYFLTIEMQDISHFAIKLFFSSFVVPFLFIYIFIYLFERKEKKNVFKRCESW